jgi:hypothetical protein
MIRVLMIVVAIPILVLACATQQPQGVEEEGVVVEKPVPIAVVEPASARPAALPQTASRTPLIGLAGIAANGGAAALHVLRRRF